MISLAMYFLVIVLGIIFASWTIEKKIITKKLVIITNKLYNTVVFWCRSPSNSMSKSSVVRACLPPSPSKLPIIGHLHLVGSLPHRSFQALAKIYGPIMHLKLGSMPVIVLSSPDMAERLLGNHDVLCAKRPLSDVSHDLSFGLKGIIFTPYNSYWRNVKKLCVMELLSSSKVRSFAWLRKEEVGKLVLSLKEASATNQAVEMGACVGGVLEELIYRMLYGSPKDDLALRSVVLEGLRVSSTINISDYLTFLAPFDLQGIKRRIKKLMVIVDNVFEKIISNHEDEAKREQRTHRDLVDVMLSLVKNSENHSSSGPSYEIERENIKGILIDLVVPAIDSSTSLVKWTLASLLKHPEKMKKLQAEIESVVGMNRIVEENDIPKFHYLDLVIKEIFRLYPIIFSPHEAIEEFSFDGYKIPKGTKIFLNSWAIGRDPTIWSKDCEEFNPERFIGNDVDMISGQDFRLVPFGYGRRSCPGTQLGLLNVKLLLSQLVHCFDWKLANGKSPQNLVMKEKFGLVMTMAHDLVLVPKYRLNDVV